jgi:hypothetical protein
MGVDRRGYNPVLYLYSPFLRSFPEVKSKCENVYFTSKCQFIVFIALVRIVEGIAEATFKPASSVDAFLQGNFVEAFAHI